MRSIEPALPTSKQLKLAQIYIPRESAPVARGLATAYACSHLSTLDKLQHPQLAVTGYGRALDSMTAARVAIPQHLPTKKLWVGAFRQANTARCSPQPAAPCTCSFPATCTSVARDTSTFSTKLRSRSVAHDSSDEDAGTIVSFTSMQNISTPETRVAFNLTQ